jgi:hypothetical protein
MFGAVVPRAPILSAGLGTFFGTVMWVFGDEIAMPIMGFLSHRRTIPGRRSCGRLQRTLGYGAAVVSTYKFANKMAA